MPTGIPLAKPDGGSEGCVADDTSARRFLHSDEDTQYGERKKPAQGQPRYGALPQHALSGTPNGRP